jgi:hypothetical protein
MFIINGKPKSGKDTFVELCIEIGNQLNISVFNYSTIDPIKELAKLNYGYTGIKDDKTRKLLHELKQQKILDDKYYTIKKLDDFMGKINIKDYIIFVHSREPDEIEQLCSIYEAQSIIIHRNEVASVEYNNDSDGNDIYNVEYDYFIDNNNTIDDLKAAASALLCSTTIK